jgi:hypothetical protein
VLQGGMLLSRCRMLGRAQGAGQHATVAGGTCGDVPGQAVGSTPATCLGPAFLGSPHSASERAQLAEGSRTSPAAAPSSQAAPLPEAEPQPRPKFGGSSGRRRLDAVCAELAPALSRNVIQSLIMQRKVGLAAQRPLACQLARWFMYSLKGAQRMQALSTTLHQLLAAHYVCFTIRCSLPSCACRIRRPLAPPALCAPTRSSRFSIAKPLKDVGSESCRSFQAIRVVIY